MLSKGQLAMSLALLVGFSAYLRPRELTGLLQSQLLGPQLVSQTLTAWCLLLHPSEGQQRSKSGHFDEGVRLDSSWSRWMSPFLEILMGPQDARRLWPFEHHELVAAVKAATATLRLEHMKPCLYSLRHGGASHDAVTGARTLEQIQHRGRWASNKSLLRYRKDSRAQLELQRLGVKARTLGKAMELNLENAFHDPRMCRQLLEQFLNG